MAGSYSNGYQYSSSYGTDNAAGGFAEFAYWCEVIESNIQRVSQNVASMQKLVNELGMPQDSENLRQLYKVQQYTNQLVKDTNYYLKDLPDLPNPTSVSEQTERKILRDRLTSQFSDAVKNFEYLQKHAALKERENVMRARAHSGLTPKVPTKLPGAKMTTTKRSLIKRKVPTLSMLLLEGAYQRVIKNLLKENQKLSIQLREAELEAATKTSQSCFCGGNPHNTKQNIKAMAKFVSNITDDLQTAMSVVNPAQQMPTDSRKALEEVPMLKPIDEESIEEVEAPLADSCGNSTDHQVLDMELTCTSEAASCSRQEQVLEKEEFEQKAQKKAKKHLDHSSVIQRSPRPKRVEMQINYKEKSLRSKLRRPK